MSQSILENIDAFIDSKSSSALSEDEAVRTILYEALVHKVTEDWAQHMSFYQLLFDKLNDDYNHGLLNAKASHLQEACANLVSVLEEVKRYNCSQDTLFHAKETYIQFRQQIEDFKADIVKDFPELFKQA